MTAWKEGDTIPSWVFGNELPRGGPDRVRFCIAYGDHMAEGHDDKASREHARSCVRLLYFYVSGMGVAGAKASLGETAYGIPLDYMGED